MKDEMFKTYKRRTSLVDVVRFTQENKDDLVKAGIINIDYSCDWYVKDSENVRRFISIGDYIAVDTKPDTFYPINASAFDKLYETKGE